MTQQIHIALTAALCWPVLAAAQASSGPIEELVVSEFRTVAPQELDTSITLIDGETIRLSSISHFEELISLVPNMNFSGDGSRARYFQLRGVGEREQYEGAPNPSVGFIVDDIDLSGIGGVSAAGHLDQVDVLRGPQSARYGSSALAGIVYVQTQVPGDELATSLEVTGGNEDMVNLSGSIGGPLSDRLRGALSAQYYEDGGFRRNEFLDSRTNRREELTLRGKAVWDLTDRWEMQLSGFYADFDNGYDAFTVSNDDVMRSDNPGEDSQRTAAGSLRITGPITGAMTFTSITGFADTEVLFAFDGDWGNADFWQTYGNFGYDYEYVNPRDRQMFSQEFRWASTPEGRLFSDTTDWVLGVYYRNLQEDNRISSTGLYSDVGEGDFCVPSCLTDRQIVSRFESDNWAVFGGLDTRFTDRFGLSLGLRVERWEADYEDVWIDINYAGPPEGRSCNTDAIECQPGQTLWGGHLALNYDLSDTVRSYLRVARGFKAGGFNPSLAALQNDNPVLGPEFVQYGNEALINYELGFKGLSADGRFRGDIALFYMDRTDAQLSQSSQQVPFDPNSFVFVTYNGGANVYGLELDGSFQANAVWEIHGALGLLKSDIDDSAATSAVSPDAAGRDLAHAPRYTLALGTTFRTDAGWYGRLDVQAVDDFYFDISHNQKSKAYETVNVRLGKRFGSFAVEAWARNLLDEDYATRGFYFGVEPPDFANASYTRFGTPRTYGLTLRYDT